MARTAPTDLLSLPASRAARALSRPLVMLTLVAGGCAAKQEAARAPGRQDQAASTLTSSAQDVGDASVRQCEQLSAELDAARARAEDVGRRADRAAAGLAEAQAALAAAQSRTARGEADGQEMTRQWGEAERANDAARRAWNEATGEIAAIAAGIDTAATRLERLREQDGKAAARAEARRELAQTALAESQGRAPYGEAERAEIAQALAPQPTGSDVAHNALLEKLARAEQVRGEAGRELAASGRQVAELEARVTTQAAQLAAIRDQPGIPSKALGSILSEADPGPVTPDQGD